MTAGNYIVCGKLDNRADLGHLFANAVAKVKLHTDRTSRRAMPRPVSCGENGIWFDGRLWVAEEFLSAASTKGIRRLIVLTNKEYLRVVEGAAARNIHIDVFEVRFPALLDIKYRSCARANYDALIKCLRKLEQLGIDSGSLSRDLSHRFERAVVKKLRFKNGYDRNFFFAYKDGYQEVFKLKEERADRLIIALDFNSMYLECMKGKFCNPASIEYKDFRGTMVEAFNLPAGVYRVRLLGARKSFLLDHHPFRYKRLGRSFFFRMNCGDAIESFLQKDEIEYFTPFFERIEILEGLISGHTIEHPLLKDGLNLYAQRMYHRRRGDRTKENMCKASIQHMHSATNQKKFAKKCFATMEQIRDFLSTWFSMNLDTIGLDEIADFLTRHKYFSLTRTLHGYQLSYLDAGARNIVFSLSAQVVANARLKMLKMLERLLSFDSVELCYTNIDSIHISIHRSKVERFFEQNQDVISNELGALKVEAIADSGYWFDVGRYWLKKDGEVIQFKNKGFSQNNKPEPFICRRKVSDFVVTPTFTHLRTYVTKIENSFSYHQRLEHPTDQESRFVRFRYEDVSEMHTANLTEAREQLSSKKIKIELFQRISNKFQT